MIAAAVVVFMLLVSLPRLQELPVSGLGLGGDPGSGGSQGVAPAKVAAGPAGTAATAGAATGVAAHRKAPATVPSAVTQPRPARAGAGGTVGGEQAAVAAGDVAGRASSGHGAGTQRQGASPPSTRPATPPQPATAPQSTEAPTQPSAAAQRPPGSTPAEGLAGVVGGHGRGASGQDSPLTPVSKVPDLITEPESSPPPPEEESESAPEVIRRVLGDAPGHSENPVAAVAADLLAAGHGSHH